MKNKLSYIPGIGESIASNLRSRFGESLCDAPIDAITDIPYVSRAKALHIKCCMCKISEPTTVIDETEPRLANHGDVSKETVTSILSQLDGRAIGRTTDAENLIRHSLGVINLSVEPYQRAINEHKTCLQNATATRTRPSDHTRTTESATLVPNKTRDGMSLRVRRQLKEEVSNFIRLFLETEGPFSTKLDAIIATRLVFDPVMAEPLPGYILADTVGCSSGYSTDFEVVEIAGEQIILRKEHAARRQVQKPEDWQRKAVFKRDEYSCVRCGAANELIIHHIVPVSQDGTDDLENLATLCEDCHADAHPDAVDTSEVVYEHDGFVEWINQ